MIAAELEDEDYVEDFGPALACPPLYVLRTADYCPECREALHVYALGCAAFRDAEEGYAIDDFHFLRRVSSVPEQVTALLTRKCSSYFLDQEEESEKPYLMNHCRCGAKLDDDFVNGDVGAAFWPDTPEGYRHIKLFELPIDEPVPVETSYMLGGDEFLEFAKAEAW